MNKRIIANRFGLIALTCLSLFASTAAFAGNPRPRKPYLSPIPPRSRYRWSASLRIPMPLPGSRFRRTLSIS